MNECKDCANYNNSTSFPNSGYCTLWEDYFNDDDGCEEFEENEDD